MRLILSRFIAVFSLLLFLLQLSVGQGLKTDEVSQLFPKAVGIFHLQSAPAPALEFSGFQPGDYGVRGVAEAAYVSTKGEKLTVAVVQTGTQSGAYALLTDMASQMRNGAHGEGVRTSKVGAAAFASADRIAFYKGTTFVSVSGKLSRGGENGLTDFSRGFARTLEGTESDVPVLVKHLPDWEKAQSNAIYALSLPALQRAVGNQPVLDAVSFDQGAEAVTAGYDGARLVIVEYVTPQIAEAADARIKDRIKQLGEGHQPVPSSYKRIGNYSVFVFNAPDEGTAARLTDQVKYEQQIQWLGDNTVLWQAAAARQHTQKAASLILGIAKTIGFFVALCLGAGGVVGGIAFLHRRAQQRRLSSDAYSDAGGMLRLNLDEMTTQPDPARLLSSGDGAGSAR